MEEKKGENEKREGKYEIRRRGEMKPNSVKRVKVSTFYIKKSAKRRPFFINTAVNLRRESSI